MMMTMMMNNNNEWRWRMAMAMAKAMAMTRLTLFTKCSLTTHPHETTRWRNQQLCSWLASVLASPQFLSSRALHLFLQTSHSIHRIQENIEGRRDDQVCLVENFNFEPLCKVPQKLEEEAGYIMLISQLNRDRWGQIRRRCWGTQGTITGRGSGESLEDHSFS